MKREMTLRATKKITEFRFINFRKVDNPEALIGTQREIFDQIYAKVLLLLLFVTKLFLIFIHSHLPLTFLVCLTFKYTKDKLI